MSGDTRVLLLHGFWHGVWCWSGVIERLAGAGRVTAAVDLAGHGLRVRRPASVGRRPFDAGLLASEVSPGAAVDLDAAGELLVSQLRRLGGGEAVTVVAHSMGGTVLTRAAQQAPDLVAHAVYVAAFMPASGVPAGDYITMPENAGELVVPLLHGDPATIGALRLDLGSADAGYRDQLRNAFFGDLDPVIADAALASLVPDAPVGIPRGATTLTPDGWGTVARTYVACTLDMAVRPALQRKFIADADAAFPDNPTSVVTLDASHGPFLSMPDQVAEIIQNLS